MHIPDFLLDSSVAAVTTAVGLGGFAYCVRKTTEQLGERTTVLMGSMSAFVFAAQMVNFPVGAAFGPPARGRARIGFARTMGRGHGDRGRIVGSVFLVP